LKKPVPLEPRFLMLKGFDFSNRKLDITVNAIRELVEVDDILVSGKYQNVPLDKEKDKEEDKDKEKEKPCDHVINKSRAFIISWNDYIHMRKSMRKNPTERAKELLIKKLGSLSSQESDQIKILNQSTENNWIGLFELKGNNYGKSKQSNTGGPSKYEGIGETIKTDE